MKTNEITPVIIESPYAGDVERNTEYARKAMLDSLSRGEAPFLSHLLYTQVLDDTIPDQRNLGIHAGLAFGKICKKTVVYMDKGMSKGMIIGIKDALKKGRTVEFRFINK